MRQRFLGVDVLAELHRRQSSHGVGVVGGRNGAGVDIFVLFFEHFPKILVVGSFGETFPRGHGLAIVHIAQRHNVDIGAFSKIGQVTFALPPCPNSGDIEFIAWGDVPLAQHMARHDKKGSCRQR